MLKIGKPIDEFPRNTRGRRRHGKYESVITALKANYGKVVPIQCSSHAEAKTLRGYLYLVPRRLNLPDSRISYRIPGRGRTLYARLQDKAA